MAARILFSVGAIGNFVQQIQNALIAAGCNLKKADRVYGLDTQAAVKQFQSNKGLTASGNVDTDAWQALMQLPVPAAGERSLQLTAAFEGHGFELAVGNFDGALLTWGIIGFTMTSGEIPSMIQAINGAHPELVKQAFGDHSQELMQLMTGTRASQKQWCDAHTLHSGALAEPWKSMFATFGSLPEVQAEQIKHVQKDYLGPAVTTARRLGFSGELGLALCFDIHVQNGGIKPAVFKALQPQIGKPEPELRKAVANAVADSARAAWRDDVRRRKLTVATGQGSVHGHNYNLENWGLSGAFMANELALREAAGSAA
jgi:peptidoglycan hydrolase-like protein with peptidoglycan-binding domain